MPILISAFVLFLQADSGAVPAAPTGGSPTSAIWEMLTNSGPVALCVLGLLLVASLYSWTVILGKMSLFKKATAQSRRFLRTFRKAGRLQEIAALSGDFKPSPLAEVFDGVYDAYQRQTGGAGAPRSFTPLERAAQSAASESVTQLEEKLTWLATIAAVSPFVGLFGTVMGIVDAFHGLGTEGSATLRAVAPGISEALITTAAGLFVAVPAVVAYNQFSARIRVFASAADDFARELLNAIEESALRPAAPVQAAPVPVAAAPPAPVAPPPAASGPAPAQVPSHAPTFVSTREVERGLHR
jgi:biopolymer transport protein TolQ